MPPTENSAALFGWHSQDSRATGPLDTADTVTAHYGTGGGNTPLIVQPCICIQGSMIGRAEKNGPQGDGLNQEVCFTLNTVDEHAVAYTFAEQNYSEYVLSPAGGTIKANGGATGGGGETLVAHNQPHYIVRRLMPLECSRLQGFPDGWGEIQHLPAGKAVAGLADNCYCWHERMVQAKFSGGGNLAYTLKIRQGCDGGGKGALIQTELSATLATNNDQTLFAPVTKE